MSQMIYDDQPQMVEAAGKVTHRAWLNTSVSRTMLRDAFAAIDREALIDKAAEPLLGVSSNYRRLAERALVAAGIIPSHDQGGGRYIGA